MSSSIKMEMHNIQSIDYVMCEHDVYCGRGNQCYHSIGNQKFRRIIVDNLNRYIDAAHKYDKSSIIDEVVDQVREKSRQYNGLGFVRKDNMTGRFYEVSNSVAREKISQTFRDALREKSHPNNKAIQIKEEKKHLNSSMVYTSDEVITSKCISSDYSKSSSHFDNLDDLLKYSFPTLRPYDSIQNELCQHAIQNYFMTTQLWNDDESSLLESIPVTNNVQDDFRLANETIQTMHSATNSDNLMYSYDNDTVISLSSSVLNLNECYIDRIHQPNIVTSTSSKANKQAQFAKNRMEEIWNPNAISDDENTFNLLLQLTESYPDLEKCPLLLQSTI